jgi:5-methyltetrahydropteroyltriglutamate--homocysteine methyltransferase
MMAETLLPTTVVGSYPQPGWLVDREELTSHMVPRVRFPKMWRVADPFLEQAQDDATIIAIRDMERAGIDVVTDGEMRRESYSNRFATTLEGVDSTNPVVVTNAAGLNSVLPRVVGKVRRRGPVEVRDMEFLRRNTSRKAKITMPGPFTMAQQVKNEFYKDIEELAMDYAVAVNEEALDIQKAGADVIQLDEPWLRNDPDAARRFGIKAINRALQGITIPTAIHLCFGYAFLIKFEKPNQYFFLEELADSKVDQISIEAAQPKVDLGVLKNLSNKKIILGVINLGDQIVERPEQVAERIRTGLKYVSPDRLIPAPDCGMKYLSREVAFGKLKAMADGAAIVRKELS